MRFLKLILLTLISRVDCFDWLDFVVDTLNYTRFAGVTTCEIQLLRVIDEFRNGSMWAARMLDSSAKLQSGLLDGNFVQPGAYDECLKVYDPDHAISGKYCLARLSYEKFKEFIGRITREFLDVTIFKGLEHLDILTLYYGMCVPDGCTGEEISDLLFNSLNISDHVCQTIHDRPRLSLSTLNGLGVFSIIILLMCASTFYEIYLHYTQEKPSFKLFLAFSYWTNGRKLFTLSKNSDQLKFVNGIRAFSIIWVLWGHMYSTVYSAPTMNLGDLIYFLKSPSSYILTNAVLSVDTFFLLSGMFIVYTYLVYKNKGNETNWGMFYLHRYIRLTPPLAAIVLFEATIYAHIGNGPMWPLGAANIMMTCYKNWWSNMLYVQNWIKPENMCAGVSWYLAVDTQLFVISPLLLIPIIKFPKISLCLSGVLATCSTAVAFYISYINKYDASETNTFKLDPTFFSEYYTQTYTRAAPWFIGFILGYIIYEAKYVKKNIKLNKALVIILWVFTMFLLIGSIYAPYLLYHRPYNPIEHGLLMALNKVFWSIGVCFLIYLCTIGYGGIITHFLSLPVFEITSRLSYCIYLVHYEIFTVIILTRRTPIYFSNYDASFYFLAYFMGASCLATAWTLTFESPIVALREHWKDAKNDVFNVQKAEERETKRQSTLSTALEHVSESTRDSVEYIKTIDGMVIASL